MKLTAGQCPALLTAIGKEIRDLWHGFKTFVTGDYTEIDMGGNSAKTADGEEKSGDALTANEMATIVVPGTERATLVTWDITNYLNDTNFNENAQVMYQYDQDGKEKASYVYGEADSRISGDLTKEAVKYTEQKAGDYSYLYDGQGNVTTTMRAGQISDSYSYDPFGEITAVTHDGTAKTPLEAQNDNGLSDNDVLWGYNGEEYIEEVGLQYLRQRHYSPETGTFTSQDTNEGDLTNPLSQNRYIYAENDPVNGNDPGGDKKKAKKTSMKKTSKKSAKSSSKSSKKTSKKTNKKTTSKKSPSKKKASNKKSSSKKSGNLWNKLKTKAKSKVNKAKKAIKKKISSVKDKAKALKKSVTCKVKKVIKTGKTLLNNTKKLVRFGMTIFFTELRIHVRIITVCVAFCTVLTPKESEIHTFPRKFCMHVSIVRFLVRYGSTIQIRMEQFGDILIRHIVIERPSDAKFFGQILDVANSIARTMDAAGDIPLCVPKV